MAQVIFNDGSSGTAAELDSNFTELYQLRNLFTISSLLAGLGISPSEKLHVNGGVKVSGPSALGATANQTRSYESPVLRDYIGDGTGFEYRISKRAASTTTDLVRFIDTGEMTIINPKAFGYGTGAGGSVAQATSKSTGVTANVPTAQITMNSASLASNTTVAFTLTNSTIGAADMVHVQRMSGGTASSYQVWCDSVASGSAVICVRNITGGALAEAVVLQFAVLKGATT